MKDEVMNGQRFRCYDDGKSGDRYTVVYMDRPESYENGHNIYACVGMSGSPFHPQGIGQHCSALPGKHLGKRIPFSALPSDCKKLVQQDLATEE